MTGAPDSLAETYGDVCSYEIASFPCKSPFVPAAAVASPFFVDLGTTSKMPLTSYTWTSGDCSSNPIAVVFQSSSSALTTSLQLLNTGSSWQVEPTDYNTVQDHTFSILVSGIDGAGNTITETKGPYTLKVLVTC